MDRPDAGEQAGRREANIRSVRSFYQYFIRDRDRFMGLWAKSPEVEIPFPPPGIPRFYKTPAEFAAFWDPIFEYSGKFDWKVVEMIVGEDPDQIVTVAESDVDALTSLGPRRYQGSYLHIFSFRDGKIASFREYVDTAFMARVYGL